jgi:aerobic-type carbon monoxide dehydrogenase small subunit (CoxS/CutS family)
MIPLPFTVIASLVGTGVSTLMSLQAQKQSLRYQQMQQDMLAKQYKDEAEAASIEMQSQEIARKRKYFDNLSSNRALMAASGVSLDSASYRAFLKSNEKIYKKDINTITLAGIEKRTNALRDMQQAQITKRAAKSNYKSGVATTIGRSLLSASSIGSEIE